MTDPVCRVCGVPVVASRSLRLLHTDEIPRGIPEHDAVATSRAMFEVEQQRRSDLKLAAAEMMEHHASLHPLAECEWAQRLGAALRKSMT